MFILWNEPKNDLGGAWMRDFMDFIGGLAENRIVKAIAFVIAAVVVVAAVIALAVAGIGIGAILLLVILIAISIYFGSIRILSGSALLAALFQVVGGNAQEFVSVWFSGPEVTRSFEIIGGIGFMHLTLLLFFVFYLLSFGTRSISLFRFENNVKVENKGQNQDEQKDKGGKKDEDEEEEELND